MHMGFNPLQLSIKELMKQKTYLSSLEPEFSLPNTLPTTPCNTFQSIQSHLTLQIITIFVHQKVPILGNKISTWYFATKSIWSINWSRHFKFWNTLREKKKPQLTIQNTTGSNPNRKAEKYQNLIRNWE